MPVGYRFSGVWAPSGKKMATFAMAPGTADGIAPDSHDIMAQLLYSYFSDFSLKYRMLAGPVASAAPAGFLVDNRWMLFDKNEMKLT